MEPPRGGRFGGAVPPENHPGGYLEPALLLLGRDEDDLDLELLALADVADLRLALRGDHGLAELLDARDLRVADREETVAFLQARLLGEAALDDALDHELLVAGDAEHLARPAAAEAGVRGEHVLAGEEHVEVRDREGAHRDDDRRVLLVLGNGGLERVELRVVLVVVVLLAGLVPEEAGDAVREERVVVAADAEREVRDRLDLERHLLVEVEVRERRLEERSHGLRHLDPRDVVRAAVVDEDAAHLGELVLVLLAVGGRAEEALLLAAPEDEADRPARMRARLAEEARRLHGRRDARP